jgi:dienelactone hydrolase
MIQTLRAVLVGFLLLSTTAVSAADDKPARLTGRWRGDLIDPVKKDVIMKVALSAPKEYPSELKGRRYLSLLILHHGYQGNEGNYIGLTVEALKRLKLDEQFVVVSGKSKGAGWTTEDDERVLRVIAWAKENYPIDPRRVFIFGSSNGAAFVGRFGSEHQDIIAGVVGYCGNYKFNAEKTKVDNAADTKTEWYFVHGSKDNPQNSRKACDFLKERGYRTIFRQMDGYGHTDIWDSQGHPDSKAANAVRDDWLRWLHWLRHKEIPVADADQKALEKAVESGDVDAVGIEAAFVGGPAAGKAILPWLQSDQVKRRLTAFEVCREAFCGKDACAGLIEALKKPDPDPALLGAVGVAANWRHLQAQAALCDFVSDKNQSDASRTSATAQLGKVVQLSLLGNFEDGRVFWTLVRLLDDDVNGVRGAAFLALAPAVADDFGYKPEQNREERRDALVKWQAWCKEKCGPPPEK